ncbi:MAG TPA: 2,3-bisphosphoglycerate-independent phosphoglycerate mutase [Syntrophorhabdus sp.]|jgi:2,3-bisphosphoglycerate-independent phosphoglycerate mutase|nr:2,3-bisphosphoglycerate-independent phosphoglycerate mutase [Syntrophorhabdus sp.]
MMRHELILNNDNKLIFLILDGVGDIPNPQFSYTTPLEAAKKPNIDSLAREKGILGRIIPVDIGITPGSGPGHLSLFGYDPLEHEIGRGVLEVLGLNMDLQDGDLAARANFCTIRDNIVVDRRAGRIPTEETVRICEKISSAIPEIEGVKLLIKPGKSHRFAVIFRGKNLSEHLTDADPHKDHLPVVFSEPKDDKAIFASHIVNTFIEKVAVLLKGEKAANGVLLRGFSAKPAIPSFSDNYGMKALAIATYPMYRGIAKVLGMDVKDETKDYQEMLKALRDNYDSYQFFFLHIKETDLAGEDGNFPQKVAAIETVDPMIPEIYTLNPQVLVITGDHSTPCPMKGHSWHPVPLLLVTKTGERDGMAFHEKNCVTGSIGTIYSKQLMPLVLAHGLRLDKYGA